MQRVPLGGGDIVDIVRLFDDWRWLNNLLAEDVALDEIRQPDLHLIAEELLRRDREDLVDFFQRLCMLANTHTQSGSQTSMERRYLRVASSHAQRQRS